MRQPILYSEIVQLREIACSYPGISFIRPSERKDGKDVTWLSAGIRYRSLSGHPRHVDIAHRYMDIMHDILRDLDRPWEATVNSVPVLI